MDTQQRQQSFLDEYRLLTEKYGLQIVGKLHPRMLGEVLQCEISLEVSGLPNWKPSEQKSEQEKD